MRGLNVKKRIFIGCALILTLAVGIYMIADRNIVETKNLHGGMMISYDTYEERFEGSDLIVIAELAADPQNVLTPYGDGYPDGHHLSKIKISEVIKSEKDFDKKEIEIREPYFTIEKGIAPGKDEIFYGDYTKMEKGNEYLLFLSWVEEWGQHGIASAHEGKFNLDGKDKAEQKMIQENEKLRNLQMAIFSEEEIAKFKK